MKGKGVKNTLSKITNSVATDNFASVYRDVLKYIETDGTQFYSRNGASRELLNFKTTLQQPLQRCVGGYNRDINVAFLIADALWMWSGRNDVSYLDNFLPTLKKYSDNGITFHGAYGFRMKEQRDTAIAMLKADKYTRRAVIQMWDRNLDLNVVSNDLPCNTSIFCNVREEKLHFTVSNRSNDVNLGLCTNVFQFSIIQELMALSIGVEVGTLTHNSASLHYYMSDLITGRVLSYKGGFTKYFNFYKDLELRTLKINGDINVVNADIQLLMTLTSVPTESVSDALLRITDIKTDVIRYWCELLLIYRCKTTPLLKTYLLVNFANNAGGYMPLGFDAWKDPYFILSMNRYVNRVKLDKSDSNYQADVAHIDYIQQNIPFIGRL